MVKWKRERKRRSYLDSYFLAQVLLTVQSFLSSVYISLGHDMQHKKRNLLHSYVVLVLVYCCSKTEKNLYRSCRPRAIGNILDELRIVKWTISIKPYTSKEGRV